jgi:hypothetical protein
VQPSIWELETQVLRAVDDFGALMCELIAGWLGDWIGSDLAEGAALRLLRETGALTAADQDRWAGCLRLRGRILFDGRASPVARVRPTRPELDVAVKVIGDLGDTLRSRMATGTGDPGTG